MVFATHLRRDALLAIGLALVLGAAWTWSDWAALSRLHLPDTDDVVRLQQIRDWLAGQAFADVTQYRLAGGSPMHWSRLPDLVPAALILMLTPLTGTYAAEVAAVVAWPLLLFATALLLVARIARALGTHAPTALAVAAIAYPATTVFLPGRIDHHGLQMVLLLGGVLALLLPASAGTGFAIGVVAAASLVVGLETAPMLAAIGVVATAGWIAARPGATARLQGLGVGALVALAAGKGVFATSAWDYPACDGFTRAAWQAAVAVAPIPLVLALLDGRLTGWRARTTVALGVAAVAAGVALWLSPACLRPYGGVDATMARLWLAQVGEAQSMFAAPPATAIGYAGVMLAGMACAGWRVCATRTWPWAALLVLQIATLAVTLTTLRGAYAGALLAAPALAAAITAARAGGTLRLVGAWAASAGMLYPLAADALTHAPDPPSHGPGDCTSPAMLAALDALPAGIVMAPIDAGAYILAGTRQAVIAAPYHRNGAGNRAAYAFYLGEPGMAEAIARQWKVTHALACAAMPGPARATPLPGWVAVRTLPDGGIIYARRLSR
ncbi:MAG: hypothetical protein JWN21_2649 [Sphingomonas bacterium]|uniref:hypothetical protein n=1 Tax=Sphingomonas bacterium TaxID=1895847 RepID=UPI002614BD18|nr:hypothetical protein [Sphingomonas bacterium]MDB5697106.1 hypothetical protein [Sphingomonas bacterium]